MNLKVLSLLVLLISVLACTSGDKTSRIVGGEDAVQNEYPYQALLLKKNKKTYIFTCGASLISELWTLTAAHCISRPAKFYRVKLGEHSRSQFDIGEVEVRVNQIIVHSGYGGFPPLNDIAVLRLSKPVTFSNAISPVCLPFAYASTPTTFDEDIATATGWGKLGTPLSTSDILQTVDLNVFTNVECNNRWANNGFTIPPSQIRAGDIDKGGCNGDSGGPLVYDDNTTIVQIGIVSWGLSSDCGNGDYPTVFTRTTSYLDWIADKTGINSC